MNIITQTSFTLDFLSKCDSVVDVDNVKGIGPFCKNLYAIVFYLGKNMKISKSRVGVDIC